MKIRLFTLLLSFCAVLSAQAQRVAGTVTDSIGNPVAQANVIEIDINHRIVSHTKTDKQGNFSIAVRDANSNRLRITADGFAIITKRIETKGKQTYVLSRKTESRLSKEEKQFWGKQRKYVITDKLFCGKSGSQSVPWNVMLEQLSDTMYVLRLPVKANDLSGIYIEGRSVTFLNNEDAHVLMIYNGEDASVVNGYPNDLNTWDNIINRSFDTADIHTGYEGYHDALPYYFYPPFLISADEMKVLVNDADNLFRLLIDTERADNYWLMYPRKSFAKELQKVLTKLKAK